MKKQSVKKSSSSHTLHRHKAIIKARRPMHRRFLLHPAVVLILLCTGVLLFGLTLKGQAIDYTVNASIPAALLTEPALILSPKDGQHFKLKPIAVTGTCPYPSYIKLYRNGVFAGTAQCNPDGTYGLLSDLSVGADTLQAHVFNTTDVEGPESSVVTVYYDPSTRPIKNAGPFIISSDYKYKGYKPGENASWEVSVNGGYGPYAFNVKWGDGLESNYVQLDTKTLKIDHIYAKSGNYTLKINGADSNGDTAYLQLSALVIDHKNIAVVSSTGSNTPTSSVVSRTNRWLWLLWPSYAILILMAFSFWLGEHEELYILQRKSNARTLKHS